MKYYFWISLSFAEIAIIIVISKIFSTEGEINMGAGEIITLAASAVILLGNIAGLFITYHKDSAKMEAIHTSVSHGNEKLEGRVEGECKDLSNEHKELSKEHRELTKELTKEIQFTKENITKDIYAVKEEINQISAFQQKEEAVRQEAAKHMPKEEELGKLVREVFENNRKLAEDNIHLREALKEKEKIIEQNKQIIKEQQEIIDREETIKRIKAQQKYMEQENGLDREDDELEP